MDRGYRYQEKNNGNTADFFNQVGYVFRSIVSGVLIAKNVIFTPRGLLATAFCFLLAACGKEASAPAPLTAGNYFYKYALSAITYQEPSDDKECTGIIGVTVMYPEGSRRELLRAALYVEGTGTRIGVEKIEDTEPGEPMLFGELCPAAYEVRLENPVNKIGARTEIELGEGAQVEIVYTPTDEVSPEGDKITVDANKNG